MSGPGVVRGPGLEAVQERARTFVAGSGDALERQLAPALAGGDAGALEDWLARQQAADGSFPPAGSVPALRRALSALCDVGRLGCPTAERACRFLEGAQERSGRWPVGSEDDDIRETGLLTGLLARTPFARARVLDAAGDWLAERFAPERVQGFAWQAIVAYGACFANLPHDASDGILQWCGRELQRGVQARRFDAIRAGRVLVWCDAPSVPGAQLAAPALVEAIAAEQRDDGSWASPDGVTPAAHACDALAVLRRFA
jgi:hypothetical protein